MSMSPTSAQRATTFGELLGATAVQQVRGDIDTRITGLCYDSRQVEQGHLFVALEGAQVDGHDYIPQALARGAGAVVVSRAPSTPLSIPMALVEDTRESLALLAARFYGAPCEQLEVVGITGTDGKTTVTYILQAALQAAGFRTAIIGTTGAYFEDEYADLDNTTPESADLQRLLRGLAEAGATHVALEVSSHGLATHRLVGCQFACRVFTNLSRDHLDFHGDMESYFEAKRSLFEAFGSGPVVFNIDDPYGQQLATEAQEAITFSQDPQSAATLRPTEAARLSPEGIHVELRSPAGEIRIESPLIGTPNLENLLAAAAVGVALGIETTTLSRGLSAAIQIPGRMERVPDPRGGRHIFVDYAHTPGALSRAVATLMAVSAGSVAVVFGCGGDRDRGKREAMGAAASDAHRVFVTSDNPRSEPPSAIIEAVLEGIPPQRRARVSSDPDRSAAIQQALGWAKPGDTVLIAGKGHEPYQEVAGVRHAYDDRDVCRQILQQEQASS